MARLSKQEVGNREDFVRELFRNNPGLSGVEVQTRLREVFGKMMRPNRIYELKREVAAEIVAAATTRPLTAQAPVTTPVDVTLTPVAPSTVDNSTTTP